MDGDAPTPRPGLTCPFDKLRPSQLVRDDAFFMSLAFNLADLLPAGAAFALVEPAELAEEARRMHDRLGDAAGLFDPDDVFARINRFPSIALAALAPSSLEAAAALAVALDAEKLVLLTDVPGLYREWPNTESLISTMTADELEALLPSLESGMIPKMTACLEAVRGGVPKAAIIDGRLAHSILLEAFTAEGIGTEVVAQ